MSSSAPFPSVAVMAEVATGLDAPISVEELLSLICLAAVDTVPGAEYAGITLADRDGNLSTPAATDPVVQRVDALQYVLMEGPCVDAIQGDWESEALDLRVDDRWPLYGPRAVELGILAQIGIQLFDEPASVASLNLYSSRPDAFDDDTVHAAHLFAIHAAHALGRVMTKTRYHDALSARASIGQATGIVMQRYTLDDKQAFEFLARLAQDTGITLEGLATQMVHNANRAANVGAERMSRAKSEISVPAGGGDAEQPDP
jgi:GAF domain-containing protein